MATIYRLTIDPIVLGITKPIDKVYIKNLYVDTDDTHIRTAPFEYGANIIGDISFVELPPTTLGSIYQIQLFGSEGMALSVFFGMPERDSLLSELAIYTAYPPRSYYPEASVAWGQLKGSIANQTDLTKIMFTKANAENMRGEINAAIAFKANTADVNSKNALQDTAINDNKIAINSKVDSAVSSINAEIALRATIANVDAKNATQDAAINLRAVKTEVATSLNLKADKAAVDSKNATQDTAITAADNLAKAAIPKSEKGAPNGVATLGADGKVTPTQLPSVTPVAWGNIAGNIAAQTDLSNTYFTQVAFDGWSTLIDNGLNNARKQGDFYNTTTADMPNTYIAPNGDMMRSTASFGTAATKNTGSAYGEIPLGEDTFKAAFGNVIPEIVEASSGIKVSDFEGGTIKYVRPDVAGMPTPISGDIGWYVETKFVNASSTNIKQIYAINLGNGRALSKIESNITALNTAWIPLTNNTLTNLNVNSIAVGVGSPMIAYKKLTGTVSNTVGDTLLAHGLNSSKILDIVVTVGTPLSGQFMVHNFRSTGFLFTQHYNVTHVIIRTFAGESTSLLGQPIKVLITYEV